MTTQGFYPALLMGAGKEFLVLQTLYRLRIVLATLRAIYSAFSNPSRRHSCLLRRKNPFRDFLCAGKDSNLRRINPGDLQSPLVDRLSTDASFTIRVTNVRTAKLLHISTIKTSTLVPVFITIIAYASIALHNQLPCELACF